jgi:glucose/arabinose dehydrogenase/mono/diheme cytochrome c family protein
MIGMIARTICLLALLIGSSVLHAQSVPAYGIKNRPAVGAFFDGKLAVAQAGASTPLIAVNAFPNLTFQNPMGMVQMPGTNWLVVWEREGTVRAFVRHPETATTTLLLDISSRCQGWDDCGIMAMVFHPQFDLMQATHRHVYLWYTYNPPGQIKGSATARPAGYPFVTCWNRLSRFDVNEFGIIQPESELVMIHQKCRSVWHKGGGMFFHPGDGFLHLTIGEDFDEKTNAQKVDRNLFGGVIRIDVDQVGGSVSQPITKQPLPPNDNTGSYTAHYYIPSDNPLVGVAGALEEFYAIGLRSPDEMTRDPVTGRIYISDVGDYGPTAREEINVIEPGEVTSGGLLNFQWHRVQGTPTGALTGLYTPSNSKPPLLEYGHLENGGTAAIMGGFVYRGSELTTQIGGRYIFADNMSGRIWALTESPSASKTLIAMLPNGPGPNRGQNYLGISSFAEDADGELYLCRLSTEGGSIFKLVPNPNTQLPAGLPTLLSQTGLFSSLLYRTPSTKLIPYTVNHPFWSDNAVKLRWAAIPTGTTVGFSPTGEWTFPTGSVFVKHFDLPSSDVVTTARRRLETRVIVKTDSGIYGGSYKWNSTRTQATLVKDTTFENIRVGIRSSGIPAGYNLGTPLIKGTSSQTGTRLVLHGAGTGVSGTADQMRFNYIKRKGDFDFFVRVERLYASIGGTVPSARVGLMLRESFASGSRAVGISVGMSALTGSNEVTDFRFHHRDTTDGVMNELPSVMPVSAAYPQVWLRLRRRGENVDALMSRNNMDWEEVGSTSMALSSTTDLLWGVTCTANDPAKRAAAIVHLQTHRIQRWTFPGTSACAACHTQAAGWVLGVNTRQLNCTFTYPASRVNDNQLRTWSHLGLFDTAPEEATLPTLAKLFAPTDATASLENRARSYLDANCASCHRPGGVQAQWDARWDTDLSSQGMVGAAPLNDLGLTGIKLIDPGHSENSLIHHRTNALGGHQMPPLGKNVIDQIGAQLLQDWINQLPP